MDEIKKVDVVTNKQFSESDKQFKQACEDAMVKTSTRQASKWRMKKGKAWKVRKAE